MYSFGMLLFEVISRRKIIDNSLPETKKCLPLLAWTMYEQGKLLDLMKKYNSPKAAEDEEQWKDTAEMMCKVAFLCVQEQPKARPTNEHGGEYGGRAFGNSSSGVSLGLNVRSTSISVTISFWFYKGRCDRHMIDQQ